MAYQQETPMHVAVQAAAHPGHPEGIMGGEWKNSLLNCAPFTSCIISTFLPCLLLGQTEDRMRDPTMKTAESMNSICMLHACLTCWTGCGWIIVMMKRTEIRERFGIPGSGCGDCCASYWCHCCAIIQQDNEVKTRLPVPEIATQQYQANKEGMVMPTPQIQQPALVYHEKSAEPNEALYQQQPEYHQSQQYVHQQQKSGISPQQQPYSMQQSPHPQHMGIQPPYQQPTEMPTPQQYYPNQQYHQNG